MQAYQNAMNFFHQHFGRHLLTDVPAFSTNVQPMDAVTCGICGRTGPGVHDKRPNQAMQRCMPCEGFFHPGPLPLTSKDQSFSAITGESHVIVDETGLHMFKNAKYLDGKPAYRALDVPYIHVNELLAGSPPVQQVIMSKLLNGDLQPPFLWFEVTTNKADTLARMVLTTDTGSVLVGAKDGLRILNLDTIREAVPLMNAVAGLPKQQLQDWRFGKDLHGDPLERVVAAAALRKSGLPESLLSIDYASRYFVMGMIPAEAKNSGKTRKPGRKAVHTTAVPIPGALDVQVSS